MKYLILIFTFLAYSAYGMSLEITASVGGTTTVKHESAQIRDCQVQNGPEVYMFGLCYKEGNTVIFKSCADFTCRLGKDDIAGPTEPGQTSCFTDKDLKKFKDSALAEHKVKKLSEIQSCGYGDKKKGEK